MYARVARFTGADRESLEKNIAAIRERSASGPPEGVPGTAFTMLVDEENGTVVAIGFFETEEDMRTGDETLNSMDPPEGPMGTRSSVDLCEVKIQVQA
jgi:ethanolamine utilization protein EutQ (cupin superfamily)